MAGLRLRPPAEENKVLSSSKPEEWRKQSFSTNDKENVADSVLDRCLSLLGISDRNERIDVIRHDARCYAMSLHEEAEFAIPHAVLCRLILTAQANGNLYKGNSSLSNSLINENRKLLVRGATSIELPAEINVFKWNDAYLSV